VALLSYSDKTRSARRRDYVFLLSLWSDHVPSERQKMLALGGAALDAVLFRCTEPAGDPYPAYSPEDADRFPIEIQDEGEPPGGE